MEVTILSAVTVLMLLGFLLGLHVASALGLLAIGLLAVLSDRPMGEMFALVAWNADQSFILAAVPMFILMGDLLVRSGATERAYSVLSHWFAGIPGGLLHTNIAACAFFSAISGSSVATAATIGSVALPAFRSRGYDERLVLGSLAAGGALGNLIPPGIIFIVYGAMMEESIGRLYMAGVVPGLLMATLFMVTIYLIARIWPASAQTESKATWRQKVVGLLSLGPMLLLIFLVLGTIYLGVATPTEAAAFGMVGAFAIALVNRSVSLAMLRGVLLSTTKTTAMIMLLVASATMLNTALTMLGVPAAMSRFVSALQLGPTEVLLVLIVFYLVMGTFMDGFALMITTLPIIQPLLAAVSIDLVWFGVIMVILCEAAIISPPHGLNLYVIQGIRGDDQQNTKRSIVDVFVGVLPFLIAMVVALALIIMFPGIALWLPNTMRG